MQDQPVFISLLEFEQLRYDQKLVAAKGALFVRSRTDGQFIYLLYRMNGFFIEVIYNKQQNFIAALNGFDDSQLLSTYTTESDG